MLSAVAVGLSPCRGPSLLPAPCHHRCLLPSAKPMAAQGRRRRFCDACGETAVGLIYHCACDNCDLHLCCAGLDRILPTDDNGDVLLLCKSKSEDQTVTTALAPGIDRAATTVGMNLRAMTTTAKRRE
ncbi:hypothetical protein E2562_018463 [Oryza meyeriana var. granulata]|uniref:DC1 domain-containing protein n=1 Tax=Oryza meyeriana var. granulata TaxID=110450 RepID=A0A6G1EMF5_9ORYZ|nr:hypothetical protein E2562_018463 [Oryza meyeriana var. granulata]